MNKVGRWDQILKQEIEVFFIGSGATEHLVWLHSRFFFIKNAFDKNIEEKL